jgi:hypothetical protein
MYAAQEISKIDAEIAEKGHSQSSHLIQIVCTFTNSLIP